MCLRAKSTIRVASSFSDHSWLRPRSVSFSSLQSLRTMIQQRMWSLALVSALFVLSSAAPQQNNNNDANLDRLIDEVFNQPPSTTPVNDGGLGGLIDNVFGSRPTQAPPINNKNPGACICVPYFLCNANGSILSDGTGIIDIRVKEEQCEGALDTCCTPPQILPDKERITPRPPVRVGCGQRRPDGVGFRITGNQDNEAQFGEFPWMTAILASKPVGPNGENLNVYQCGGALIHPQAVLTAAHCVKGKHPSEVKIRAGEWDTQTKSEIYPHQDRDVSKIIAHQEYNAGSLRSDFAILILASPLQLTENVDLVCLADENAIFDYARCFASGWGKDVFGKEGEYQVILKKIELPIVPFGVCQDALRTTRLGTFFQLDQSFICAGGEAGKDTCKGDGGSPLVCPLRDDPSRYVQAGIVAWGIGCGENQIPGVYASVARARSWIDQIMAQYNLDNSLYRYNPNY